MRGHTLPGIRLLASCPPRFVLPHLVSVFVTLCPFRRVRSSCCLALVLSLTFYVSASFLACSFDHFSQMPPLLHSRISQGESCMHLVFHKMYSCLLSSIHPFFPPVFSPFSSSSLIFPIPDTLSLSLCFTLKADLAP